MSEAKFVFSFVECESWRLDNLSVSRRAYEIYFWDCLRGSAFSYVRMQFVIEEKFDITSSADEDNNRWDYEVDVRFFDKFRLWSRILVFVKIDFEIENVVFVMKLIVVVFVKVFFILIWSFVICSLKSVIEIKRSKWLTLISLILRLIAILILILRSVLIKILQIECVCRIISYLLLRRRH